MAVRRSYNNTNPAVGCHHFPSDQWLVVTFPHTDHHRSLTSTKYQLNVWWQRHIGVDDVSSVFKCSAMFIIAIQLPYDVNT